MAKKIINIGQSINDKSGDPLRTAFSKINDNFTELYDTTTADNPADRLINGDKELVLNVDSITPDRAWVDFPAAFGESITVQGAEIGSVNGPISMFGQDRVLLSTNNSLTSDRLDWQFDSTSTLSVPHLFPRTFTAVLDNVHMVNPVGIAGDVWSFDIEFQSNPDGTIQTIIDNNTAWPSNPGYLTDYEFEYTEADHGIAGYTFTLTITDIQHPGEFLYTANLVANNAPPFPRSITSPETLVLHGHTSVVLAVQEGIHEERFVFEGRNLILPGNGDIRDHDGNSVLGGAPAQLQAVPTTREGQAGDKAGMMAIDTMTNYVYICKTDYTSGAEIIWLRIQGDTAW